MEFIDEYKSGLAKCFEEENMQLTKELIEAFHKLNYEPDAECLYYEAAYYYYISDFCLALYYADMCYLKNPEYSPVWELLTYLTDYEGDFSKYIPTFTTDVSSYRKKLNIMLPRGFMPIVDYTVDVFADKLRCLGHNVSTLKVVETEGGFKSNVDPNEIIKMDLVCEFNNMGAQIKDKDNRDFYEKNNIPIYSYMFDHPMYFANDFLVMPKNRVIMTADRNHSKYIKRFYKRVADTFFLPLGSEEKPGNNIPWEERTIRCLYVGSLKEPEAELEDDFSKLVFEFQKNNTAYTTEGAIIECYMKLSQDEYESLFDGILKMYPKKPTDDDFLVRLIYNYCFCDLKINSLYRKRLVEVLVENGIDVEVYGNGWTDPKLLNNPYFHFGGLIPQEDCIKKMQNTKFILNSMPWFKDGTHDRIYNAMLAGGICVTDTSKYLLEEFTDGEDIVYYDLDHMEKLPDIIRYYEAHPELIQPMLDKAYSKTVLKHSWTNRIITMMEHFFDCREKNRLYSNIFDG